ncbi:organic hydroperoxide reductase OsmC/OhrA [Actinoalloteichus hoggarensis]|uniref:OsmC-like protein n=1 Tax=Actinoalloteichus hoggarensis TaxID=1470176 RepID=A0A221W275_9PSEU|nr:OsmC family protein [Actinoalloteichus hoggarensis]ASO19827.1 OsmC-like protein [Actinoalloteichus hoggarensis]MBB5919465.1 organic hydroperoxide reductase OsmC/OhrA [Actinoalloteichus hoggarensis]
MTREHHYEVTVSWRGNTGTGTSGYRSYERSHDLASAGLPIIEGSADPAFVGDASRWNPEQLLLGALSQCHMLSYLALCSLGRVVVVAYEDSARGLLHESARTRGRFTEVILAPLVTVASESMVTEATALHRRAHEVCFIANSVNFPVRHVPTIRVPAGHD